jgi:hypothetical protein
MCGTDGNKILCVFNTFFFFGGGGSSSLKATVLVCSDYTVLCSDSMTSHGSVK